MEKTITNNQSRGASSTIGYVFILSTVLLSATVLIGVGIVTITESQEQANVESSQQAMTQLDSQMSLTAFEGGAEQTVDLALDSDEQVTIENDGHITVQLETEDPDNPGETKTVATIMDRNLNSLVNEISDDHTIAYQAGGVWAMNNQNPNQTEMISPPEFSFDDQTGTLPIVGIAENEEFVSTDGQLTLNHLTTDGKFPHRHDEDLSNPIDSDKNIVLTIQSDYYQAWGDYFESRLDVTPGYTHDENEVKLVFVPEVEEEEDVERALTSVGSDNRIEVNGQGGDVFVDSYDSQEGPYSDSQTEGGDIAAQSGVDVSSGAEIRGNVITEGDLVLSGNSIVHGDATVNGNVETDGAGSEVVGEEFDGANVQNEQPVDNVIESVGSDLEEENNNDDPGRISSGEITSENVLTTGTSPTISAGDYYLSELDMGDGDSATFDLSNGNITVFVDGSVSMERAEIDVVNTEGNSNRVQIFQRGSEISFDRSEISIEGDRSPAMWLYSGSGTIIDLHRSEVTGTVYAPGTDTSPGEINVNTHSALYGAVIGGDTEIGSQSQVSYDAALDDRRAFIDDSNTELVSARVTYFHISYTEIEVRG